MPPQFDVEETLKKLSVPQKVQLLAGLGFWHTQAIESAGIKSMRMSHVFNGVPSSCFQSATGIGSSFDIELAHEVGDALADECRAKSVHILLGPTVNTQRSPLGGRGFESFSEDPHLNGTIAAAYIQGVQAKGVATTLKHYVANEQEYQRFSSSSEVNERALREIYLKPFQIVVKKANPWVMMAALRLCGSRSSQERQQASTTQYQGPNARRAFTSGGGSAEVLASYTVSPLQGIEAVGKDAGFAVEYATGAMTFRYLPVLDGAIQFKDGDTKRDGALLEFWNHEPAENWLTSLVDGGIPVWSTATRVSHCPLIDSMDNSKVNFTCWYRYSTLLTPDRTGDYDFELIVGGRGALFVNGKVVIDLTGDVPDGSPIFGSGTVSARGSVTGLQGGQLVALEARLSNQTFIERGTGYETRGGVRLGATPVISDEDALAEAIALAKESEDYQDGQID
ncbi:hypothetical protein DENSPDRAFT_851627 [Dentipellis sp. KUC8613]|nr:hypothetical protein DENSPDRAFT_851627 [Dentipellis sp. KUC8613]